MRGKSKLFRYELTPWEKTNVRITSLVGISYLIVAMCGTAYTLHRDRGTILTEPLRDKTIDIAMCVLSWFIIYPLTLFAGIVTVLAVFGWPFYFLWRLLGADFSER